MSKAIVNTNHIFMVYTYTVCHPYMVKLGIVYQGFTSIVVNPVPETIMTGGLGSFYMIPVLGVYPIYNKLDGSLLGLPYGWFMIRFTLLI